MDAPDALATIAEIAIAIAGFSGVAAVLGRRSQGEWSSIDVFRLRVLLLSSFSIVVLCFLPIVLNLASLTPSLVWPLSSGVCVAMFVLVAAVRTTQIRRLTRTTGDPLERRYAFSLGALFLTMFALHVVNLLLVRGAWPYVAAVVCNLVIPFSFFVRLLRTILRGDAGAAE
jgi:hypothetical protein